MRMRFSSPCVAAAPGPDYNRRMRRPIEAEESGGAVRVSLARPPLNVLDIPTIRELDLMLQPLAERRDLKVLVLRSALPGVFSAGVDVADHRRERVPEMLESFHAVFRRLDGLPQVTVAAVDGVCLGGGCELAAFCDVVLATPTSTFGQPEIDVGCFPPVAAVWLPRLIGRAAYAMVLGGEPVSAAEAARMGLITAVADDLAAETSRWVERLGRKSAAVLALARRALRQGPTGAFADGLSGAESIYRNELTKTEDMEEGVRAFLEKRKPAWKDR
jgi:cyclohexa-1,5-dienecarbonyl-CoA hydratase